MRNEADRAARVGARRQSRQLAGDTGRSTGFAAGDAIHGGPVALLPRESEDRGALPDETYAAFFDRGEVDATLARELVAAHALPRAAGHWVPDVGESRESLKSEVSKSEVRSLEVRSLK